MGLPWFTGLGRHSVWPVINRTWRILLVALAFAGLAACSSSSDPPLATPAYPVQPIEFVDITVEAGLSYDNFGCMAFDDFDGDGLPDLVLAPLDSPGAGAGINIHRNQGDGTFAVHFEPTVPFLATSCTTGDLDADGHLDIVVGHAPTDLTILMGAGELQFERVVRGVPSVRPEGELSLGIPAISLFDFDRDGDLDILGGRTLLPGPETCEATDSDFRCDWELASDWSSTFLFRNTGDRVWEAVEPAPGGREAAAVHSFGFVDLDRDGWLDVFITQDFTSNALYLNDAGSGVFEDVTEAQGLALYNHGMGSAFADFDRDGEWDIYVADLGPDQLWLGSENGTFEEQSRQLGIFDPTLYHSGWSPQVQDFNHDGFPDIFVTNSALLSNNEDLVRVGVGEEAVAAPTQADFLFTADQQGGYATTLIPHYEDPESRAVPNGSGSAVADFDGDGDLDLAQFYLAPPTFRLLENQTQDAGNWVHVQLEPESGFAYGAEVEAHVDGALLDRRVLHGATGSPGKSWETLHFGLGDFDQIDEFIVWWPGREKQTIEGPFPANQVHVLRQG